jgi:RNA recognition motif-containing protein
MQEQSGPLSIFFARFPPTVVAEELLALFKQYGDVVNLNLFRRWATARTTKVKRGDSITELQISDEQTSIWLTCRLLALLTTGVQGCGIVTFKHHAAAAAALNALNGSKLHFSNSTCGEMKRAAGFADTAPAATACFMDAHDDM